MIPYPRPAEEKPLSPVDHAVHLAAIYLRTNVPVLRATLGRVWLADEIKPQPVWPFVVIADARLVGNFVRVSIECWARFTSESQDVAHIVRNALPSKFAFHELRLVRPVGVCAGAAVATLHFAVEP